MKKLSINYLMDDFPESNKIEILCLNDINKDKVIDYIAIFQYVSELFLRDIYIAPEFILNSLNPESLYYDVLKY